MHGAASERLRYCYFSDQFLGLGNLEAGPIPIASWSKAWSLTSHVNGAPCCENNKRRENYEKTSFNGSGDKWIGIAPGAAL
jgi:hypothetical protein